MSRLGLSGTELAARLRDVVRAPLMVDGSGGLRIDPRRVLWPLKITDAGELTIVQNVPRKVTAAANANYGDLILADPTAGAFAVQFPSYKDHPGGVIVIKNRSASTNAITATAHTGESIDAASTLAIAAAWAARTFYAADDRWVVL